MKRDFMKKDMSELKSSSQLSLATVEICSYINKFIEMLSFHGYQVKNYTEKSIFHFENLESTQKESILSQFKKYSDICFELHKKGLSLRDNRVITNEVLLRLGIVSPDSFYQIIENNDLIEVYDTSGIQIFRNFIFFEMSSYTLLEILAYPWYELVDRPSSITAGIMDCITKVLGEHCSETFRCNIPTHQIREIFSEEMRLINAKFNYFAPLFRGAGSKVGFICSGLLNLALEQEEHLAER